MLSKDQINKYQQKFEQLKRKTSGSGAFYFFKDGTTRIRLLPDDSGTFYRDVAMHYLPGTKRLVWCQSGSGHGDCIICEKLSELEQKGKDVRQYVAKGKSLANGVVRGAEKNPCVLVLGTMVQKQILQFLLDPDYGDPCDVKIGYDIDIDKSGQGLDTEYAVKPRPQKTPLDQDRKIVLSMLDNRSDLSTVTVMDQQELIKIWDVFARGGNKSASADISDDEIPADDEDDTFNSPHIARVTSKKFKK